MFETEIPAAKVLRGLGIVGDLLKDGEQPLPVIRRALVERGFTNHQISSLFDIPRSRSFRRISNSDEIWMEQSICYWSLEDVVFKP